MIHSYVEEECFDAASLLTELFGIPLVIALVDTTPCLLEEYFDFRLDIFRRDIVEESAIQ